MVSKYKCEIILAKYKLVGQFYILKVSNNDMKFSNRDCWRI